MCCIAGYFVDVRKRRNCICSTEVWKRKSIRDRAGATVWTLRSLGSRPVKVAIPGQNNRVMRNISDAPLNSVEKYKIFFCKKLFPLSSNRSWLLMHGLQNLNLFQEFSIFIYSRLLNFVQKSFSDTYPSTTLTYSKQVTATCEIGSKK